MPLILGILFAVAALLFWGGGDFLLQRTTRKVGDWETLFVVTVFGTLIMTPFIYSNLMSYLLVPGAIITLSAVSIAALVGALLNFEALKKGKIVVIEPILSLDIPVVAFLSFLIVSETLQPVEVVLVVLLIFGLGLVSLKKYHLSSKIWLERGIILALIAAILYGVEDFLVGFGARITNPIFINWFVAVTLMIYTFGYLAFRHKLGKVVRDVKRMPVLVFTTCFLDNVAWIFFGFATVLIPITIAVAISDNYIAIAALLGLYVNRERFLAHQKVGLVLALASATVLALIS